MASVSSRWMGRTGICLFLLFSLFAGGCDLFFPKKLTPEETVRAFAQALSRKDYKDAYKLMSKSYCSRVSFEQFKNNLEQNPEETLKTSLALSSIVGSAEQEAVVIFGKAEQIRLVHDENIWHITDNIVDFYSQATPRDALLTFIRAMERKRYEIVLRLIPNADKEGITVQRMRDAWTGEGREDVERLLSNLRANMDKPIEEIGNHATMPYNDQLAVQFIREDGLWKIEDPE